jgi:hypothetical protein
MSKSASPTATVIDLSAYGARRHAADADKAAGQLLYAELVAEADEAIAAGAL